MANLGSHPPTPTPTTRHLCYCVIAPSTTASEKNVASLIKSLSGLVWSKDLLFMFSFIHCEQPRLHITSTPWTSQCAMWVYIFYARINMWWSAFSFGRVRSKVYLKIFCFHPHLWTKNNIAFAKKSSGNMAGVFKVLCQVSHKQARRVSLSSTCLWLCLGFFSLKK